MGDPIIEKLDEMDSKLDEILTWKAVHKEEHKIVHRDVTEMRGVLFENPGLKAQVQALVNCKRYTSKWKEFWMGVLRTVLAAAIIGVLMWLMLVYKTGTT